MIIRQLTFVQNILFCNVFVHVHNYMYMRLYQCVVNSDQIIISLHLYGKWLLGIFSYCGYFTRPLSFIILMNSLYICKGNKLLLSLLLLRIVFSICFILFFAFYPFPRFIHFPISLITVPQFRIRILSHPVHNILS